MISENIGVVCNIFEILIFFAVLHVGSEWKEFFYDSLKPWYHYIPVPDATRRSPVSDEKRSQGEMIEGLLKFLKYDDDKSEHENVQSIAQHIASNGRKFIEKHLTMKDVENYWYDLLSKYTKLLDFQPSLNKHYILINQ